MTDPEIADKTYIEPITKKFVEEIIKIEDCSFRILEADDRRLSSIEVTLD